MNSGREQLSTEAGLGLMQTGKNLADICPGLEQFVHDGVDLSSVEGEVVQGGFHGVLFDDCGRVVDALVL
jgi:hypothetical protein